MADSVDRVFVHALNTVKRIPRLGSARPPPAERLKLYGLYKQSMEGDVAGVMERPQGWGEEVRSEQAKWDAWHTQKGLSKTEAKRTYIATLIETMHKYANHTPDARELVGELEFVWAQIKSNPPSDSSSSSPSNSASYPSYQRNESSPPSSDPAMYAHASDRSSRGHLKRRAEQEDASGRLRVLSPMSQSQEQDMVNEDEDEADDQLDVEQEDFVDAPDSQIGLNDGDHDSLVSSREADELAKAQDPGRGRTTAGNILGPIVRYLTMQTQETQKLGDTTTKWQRRIESALIKMNAEMAALREQLEMQHQSAYGYSSFNPFARRRRGIVGWMIDSVTSFAGLLVKHILLDATLLIIITIWMHYRGIPGERLEELISSWIRSIQQLRMLQRFRRIQQSPTGRQITKSIPKSLKNQFRSRR